jgi:thiamine biosynthesis lipoprotein
MTGTAAAPGLPALRLRFTVMGGPGEVQVAAPTEALARAWAQAAADEAARIEARFSRYRADSWLGRVNAAAGSGQAMAADDEAMALLRTADALWRDSGGRFDATSGVLRHAWRFGTAVDTVAAALAPPSAQALQPLLARVGWDRVRWRDGAVALPEPGMELDFGGFGKEYAVDRMIGRLQSLGAAQALVNLAGDCRALGSRPDGAPWTVGIAHPRQPGALLATLPLQQAAVATSGDYERGFWHAGRRYGHVLDARTGWPVAFWASVSVLAPTALQAGNAATLALLAEGDALPALRASGLDFLAVEAASGAVHHR